MHNVETLHGMITANSFLENFNLHEIWLMPRKLQIAQLLDFWRTTRAPVCSSPVRPPQWGRGPARSGPVGILRPLGRAELARSVTSFHIHPLPVMETTNMSWALRKCIIFSIQLKQQRRWSRKIWLKGYRDNQEISGGFIIRSFPSRHLTNRRPHIKDTNLNRI